MSKPRPGKLVATDNHGGVLRSLRCADCGVEADSLTLSDGRLVCRDRERCGLHRRASTSTA